MRLIVVVGWNRRYDVIDVLEGFGLEVRQVGSFDFNGLYSVDVVDVERREILRVVDRLVDIAEAVVICGEKRDEEKGRQMTLEEIEEVV